MDRERLGKVDRAFFDSVIYPNLGADRADVALGPKHGVDFGVLEVGDRAVVVATDPISILPALGWERAGAFALEVVLADVAVSGIAPTHVAPSLTLPPGMTDDELERTWRGLADRAESLGVSVVAGHTARYGGIDYSWVGGATAMGVGDPGDVVRPDGARPGDALVVTTGPAAEVAGLFATLFGDELSLPESTLATARERIEDLWVVEDALAAADAGAVSAMHDATEGGIVGGVAEMATGAGVRVDLRREAVPVAPAVEAVCDAIGVNPWHVTSSGTLLIAVATEDADEVVDALESRGTRAAVVGEASEGNGVHLDGEPVEPPPVDPSWAAFEAFAGRD